MAIMTRFSKGMQGNIRLDQVKVWPVESEKDKEKWNRLVCRYPLPS